MKHTVILNEPPENEDGSGVFITEQNEEQIGKLYEAGDMYGLALLMQILKTERNSPAD
jgi:hypothetical protein